MKGETGTIMYVKEEISEHSRVSSSFFLSAVAGFPSEDEAAKPAIGFGFGSARAACREKAG